MKRLSAGDLKDLNLLKHYRIIRKWACKNNNSSYFLDATSGLRKSPRSPVISAIWQAVGKVDLTKKICIAKTAHALNIKKSDWNRAEMW